ncbi:MAG: hypothetical protein QM640_02190 [Niabella sp.]
MTNKRTITYLYDAVGNKLKKTVTEGSTQTLTDYIGPMIFEDNVLQYVPTSEGRMRPTT